MCSSCHRKFHSIYRKSGTNNVQLDEFLTNESKHLLLTHYKQGRFDIDTFSTDRLTELY
jgi:hypothetical protein